MNQAVADVLKEGSVIKTGACFPQRVLNIVESLLGVDPDYMVKNAMHKGIGFLIEKVDLELKKNSVYDSKIKTSQYEKIPVRRFMWDYGIGSLDIEGSFVERIRERNFVFHEGRDYFLRIGSIDPMFGYHKARYTVQFSELGNSSLFNLSSLEEKYCNRDISEENKRLFLWVETGEEKAEVKIEKLNFKQDNVFLNDFLEQLA